MGIKVHRFVFLFVLSVVLIFTLVQSAQRVDTGPPISEPRTASPASLPKVTLDRQKYPRLYALTDIIANDKVRNHVINILSVVDGIERDALLCVPSASRVSESDAVIILPEAAVHGRSSHSMVRPTGTIYGPAVVDPSTRPTELRNKLLDACVQQRSLMLKEIGSQLLDETRVDVHVRVHEAAQLLDRIVVGMLKRIAVSCSLQKERLGLDYTMVYNGIYNSDFVSSELAI